MEVLGATSLYDTKDECESKCNNGIRPCNETECDVEQCPRIGTVLYCVAGQEKGGCVSNWVDRPGCDNICDTTNCHNGERCDDSNTEAK